jgi:arylsulfatase A-like enzyme
MPVTSRRQFLQRLGLGTAAFALSPILACNQQKKNKPNMIVVFCDDLGYGDLSVFGHPTIHTPNLDRMAAEGQKWTQFYVAASVCTPSRAALMTGRYPVRTGMCSDVRRVLFPDSAGGLPESEITIARVLKNQGYATACVGKWHLGHLPQYLPTSHGFDTYFGIPYSNDMDRVGGSDYIETCKNPTIEDFEVPLMRDKEVIERPANQHTITKRYTKEVTTFIRDHQKESFFIYFAHSMPHVPLFRSDEFAGDSRRGIYGDVIQEIDWSVGQVLDTLRETGLDENTLVVFTSDNGPWLLFDQHGGSAGLLKDGKGTTFEGGMREPTIFWWPGKIKPGVIMDLGSTLDLFPTYCALAGAELPRDRVYDGWDLSPVLFKGQPSPRQAMFYYRGTKLYAVRKGAYKAHFITQSAYGNFEPEAHDPPLLYDLDEDPGETFNVADQHPDVMKEILELVAEHNANMTRGQDCLAERL